MKHDDYKPRDEAKPSLSVPLGDAAKKLAEIAERLKRKEQEKAA